MVYEGQKKQPEALKQTPKALLSVDVTKYFGQLLGCIFQATFRGYSTRDNRKPTPFPQENTEELLQMLVCPSKSTYSSFMPHPLELPRTEVSRDRVGRGKNADFLLFADVLLLLPMFFLGKTSRKEAF